jgi:hypothetical protein
MTNDGPRRFDQRFSRFSRNSYEDVLPPPPPEEPSLTEIAARALNAHRETPPIRPRAEERWPGGAQRWDQPPPPEPTPQWAEDRQPVAPPPLPSGQPGPPVQQPAPRRPHPGAPIDAFGAPPQSFASEPMRGAPPAKPPRKSAVSRLTVAASRLAAQGWAFTRSKGGPALVNSAMWLAHNLRRREIRKRYNRALVFGHTRVADRKLEDLFFISTRTGESIDPAPERGIHYDGPVPAAVLDWVMSVMPADLRQFAFVDVRAGRGRTSLLAAKWNLNRIIAYEYDAQIFDDLQMNIAQYPRSRMACRRIDCYRGDVDGIRLPDQPCIIYFSGAWREPMIDGVMSYVRETYRQSPRRVYIIFENIDEQTALGADGIFEAVEPKIAERMKLRLLSPMDFRIYRSAL